MKVAVLRAVVLLGVVAVLYAPGAFACSTCNVGLAETTVDGVTYHYQVGGCATPASDSWGSEDCHSQYQVVANFQVLVECDLSGFGCYYTEVNGAGGSGDGSGTDNLSEGNYQAGSGGYCSAEYISCH